MVYALKKICAYKQGNTVIERLSINLKLLISENIKYFDKKTSRRKGKKKLVLRKKSSKNNSFKLTCFYKTTFKLNLI